MVLKECILDENSDPILKESGLRIVLAFTRHLEEDVLVDFLNDFQVFELLIDTCDSDSSTLMHKKVALICVYEMLQKSDDIIE